VVNTLNHGRTSTEPGRERYDRESADRCARHERAVEQTLRWALEAAAEGAFGDALEWLRVVEVVDVILPPGWERTQQLWVLLEDEQHAGTSRAAAKPLSATGAISAPA